jgi:hypothetical protein
MNVVDRKIIANILAYIEKVKHVGSFSNDKFGVFQNLSVLRTSSSLITPNRDNF